MDTYRVQLEVEDKELGPLELEAKDAARALGKVLFKMYAYLAGRRKLKISIEPCQRGQSGT